jgi:hypothetical protein
VHCHVALCSNVALLLGLNPSHTRAYDDLRPPATCKTDYYQRLSATKPFLHR